MSHAAAVAPAAIEGWLYDSTTAMQAAASRS